MTEGPGPLPPAPVPGPAAPAKKFPTPLQAVILTLSGLAMAFFGCLGAISQYDQSDVLFGILLVAAVTGALAMLLGMGIIAFMFVQGVVKAFRESRAPTPPEPPPPADPDRDARG